MGNTTQPESNQIQQPNQSNSKNAMIGEEKEIASDGKKDLPLDNIKPNNLLKNLPKNIPKNIPKK